MMGALWMFSANQLISKAAFTVDTVLEMIALGNWQQQEGYFYQNKDCILCWK